MSWREEAGWRGGGWGTSSQELALSLLPISYWRYWRGLKRTHLTSDPKVLNTSCRCINTYLCEQHRAGGTGVGRTAFKTGGGGKEWVHLRT